MNHHSADESDEPRLLPYRLQKRINQLPVSPSAHHLPWTAYVGCLQSHEKTQPDSSSCIHTAPPVVLPRHTLHATMLEFRTQGYNSYSVKYSPFFDSRIAVAASANFGLVGNGRLYILSLTPNGVVADKWYRQPAPPCNLKPSTTDQSPPKRFDTQDSLFDTAWSEAHENQILTASGDGSIKLFDISLQQFPIASWQEHSREVFSVHWNLLTKDTFLSSSWDGCIKIWSPNSSSSLLTLPTHSCTYSAAFSPHSPSVLSAVTSDSHLRIFDLRTPPSASNHLTLSIPIHTAPKTRPGVAPPAGIPPSEALTHDWNKYRDSVLATAGVDRAIRSFDIRAPGQGPVAVLPGHEYAVRRVAWSPHLSDVLLSASYDMTCRVWTDGTAVGFGGGGAAKEAQMGMADPMVFGGGRELGRMGRHTEFVTGVDWCLFGAEGWAASCGWDERVLIWDVRETMGP